MKKLFECFLLLFVVTALWAQSDAEREVKKTSDANLAAILHGDLSALQNQYTDDYYRTGDTGQAIGKSEFLKRVADTKSRPENIELTDRKFRIYGDTAVETGINKATYQREGKAEVRQSRYTVVWRKENGTWKKAVYQSTSLEPIPAEAYRH